MNNGIITHDLRVDGARTNGDPIGPLWKKSVRSAVADVYRRYGLSIGTTVQTLLTVGTEAGATLAAINRLVIHNLDATNFIRVGIIVSGSKSAYLKVLPGETLSINPSVLECDDDSGAAFSAFSSVTSITLAADTAACECDVVAY